MPPVDTFLRVNDKDIQLDKFTRSFINSTVLGMLSPLHGLEDPGELKSIKIYICGQDTSVTVDGVEIGMNSFVRDIVRGTIKSMVAPLRGVESEIRTLELILLMSLTEPS